MEYKEKNPEKEVETKILVEKSNPKVEIRMSC
jgi:hypothetical protein